MESAISTSLLARRHQNGLPALTFHHVFAIVPDRGFDGIHDLDKLARPQAPERASCPDFSPKAASSGMPRLLFQKQSRDNAGTMIPARRSDGRGM
jgi:hypothetical protein